jgi:FKBP-type peptidyl-prolyl cis-trans isomerase 2
MLTYIPVFIHYQTKTMKKIIAFLALTSLSFFMFTWCTNKNNVQQWNIVSLTYTATFSNGELFDQATNQTPLMFTVGSGQVIQWLDEGVLGIAVGDTKTITITPKKWYGKLYDPNNIQKISQLIFDKLSIQPKNWTPQKLGNIEGIVKWTEQDASGNVLVLFDINPRQTRDTLKYTITVLDKK